jgi:hypothetical protein
MVREWDSTVVLIIKIPATIAILVRTMAVRIIVLVINPITINYLEVATTITFGTVDINIVSMCSLFFSHRFLPSPVVVSFVCELLNKRIVDQSRLMFRLD